SLSSRSEPILYPKMVLHIRNEDATKVGAGAESAVLGFALFHRHRYTMLDEAQTGPERLEMLQSTQNGGWTSRRRSRTSGPLVVL
ncbi:MAG: hypothetical protein NWP79_10680, partial [Paracoccaceae bacterium]|nr:hypothetical protein [Paracoccaceae bacterium]